jgi:RNA polymerase sigma-70 factor (ECF subfamily)
MDPVEPQTASLPRESAAAPEDAVLRLARSGDEQAFEQLVLVHQARVYSLALRLTGQRADAEDVAQDVFVQLYVALAQVSSAAHLKHWLLRAVTYRAIDRLRQQARQGSQVSLATTTDVPPGLRSEATEDPLAATLLRRLLMELQPDARAVLVLRFQEDLDPAEISTVLGMPVNTVKSHLRRSIEWLRTQCAGETHGS